MEEEELLVRAREKIAKLRPKGRKLGVVAPDGSVEPVVVTRAAVERAGRDGRVIGMRQRMNRGAEHD